MAVTEPAGRIRLISAREMTPKERRSHEQSLRPDDMRDEYEFSPEALRNAPRGQYADRYAHGTNVIVLDPAVAQVFPDSAAVNRALRAVASIIKERTQTPAA